MLLISKLFTLYKSRKYILLIRGYKYLKQSDKLELITNINELMTTTEVVNLKIRLQKLSLPIQWITK